MTWPITITIICLLALAGYLLWRNGVLDAQNVVAGGGFLAVLTVLWRLVFGRGDQDKPEDPKPTPPTQDADRVIEKYHDELKKEPPEDIHDRLKDKLKDHI